jgi:hypothetical protein
MFDKYNYYTITLISDKFGKYLDSIQRESWKKSFELNSNFPDVGMIDTNVLHIHSKFEGSKAPASLNEVMTRLSQIFLVDESELIPYIDDIKEIYWEEGCCYADELYVRENYAPDVLEEMYDYIIFGYEDDEDVELESKEDITDDMFEELINYNLDEFSIYTKFEYNNGNSKYINHDPFNNFYF